MHKEGTAPDDDGVRFRAEQAMGKLQPEWPKLGPLPTDPKLEKQLDQVKQTNDHQHADEKVWMVRSRENASAYAAAEARLFSELDKQLKTD
jgi:hypothetical protein